MSTAQRASDWQGRTVAVTGSTSGIGHRLAIELSSRGAHLVLIGRSAARLTAFGRELGKNRPGATFDVVELDLAGDIEHSLEALSVYAGVDLLVHSAGTMSVQALESTSGEIFDRHYRVNVRSVFLLTRSLLPALRTAAGQIVFINSSAAQQKSRGNMAAYTASKYALWALADSLRDEVNPDGVRVVSVFPGRTATPMQAYLHAEEGKEYKPNVLLQPDDVAQAVMAALSLPRTAEVTDISVRPFHRP